jgi:hypothetical protein
LRIGKAELSGEDFRICGCLEAWVEFPYALCRIGLMGGMRFAQVFGLMFQVVKIGIRREVSHRHDELPFVCPGPHVEG